jgi:hypothetical protein
MWTEAQYAAFVKKSIHSVRRDRRSGKGAPWVRVSGAIRYFPAAVEDFLMANAERACMAKR